MDSTIEIGWREWVGLPTLGIPAIKAKIDTGARTSSLHTDDLEVFERDGVEWVRFHITPIRKHPETALKSEVPVYKYASVRDSGGHLTERPYVKSRITIGGQEWEIELNFSDRGSLLFPMLLGRTAMAGRCKIDPSRSYIHGRWGRKAYPTLKTRQ